MSTDTPAGQSPQSIRDEFRLINFRLQHHALDDFCRSQWQTGSKSVCFLLYRWGLSAFFGTGLCVTLYKCFHSGRYFIYLTHWGFIMCSVTSITGAILVTIYHTEPRNLLSHTKLIKFYWACYWINLVLANIIGLMFWAAIYPTDPERIRLANRIHFYYIINIWTHGMPSLCFTVDHMLVAHPSRLLHVVYPFGFAMVYLGFSVVYHLCGGRNIHDRPFIYAILNYSRPASAAKTIGVFTGLLGVCSCVQYGIYRLRVFLARKLGKLIE